MIDTPIYNFVKNFTNQKKSRYFMPGHKGNHPYDDWFNRISSYDLTEISGADALFEADGIIGESEHNAATLFGSKATLYSTQGSTLAIQTMVALAAERGDTIIAGRNAHMAFCNACTLLRMKIYWVLPQQTDSYGVCGRLTAEQIESAIGSCSKVAAVYITSPDYLGNTSDIEAIAKVCNKYNILLCCDNAHGAYLTCGDNHPLKLGASMCCDSAHKTLPVLTGGAYLHLSEGCPFSKDEAKAKMALFSSTSPSYLILTSLDLCNRYLCESANGDFEVLRKKISQIKRLMDEKNIAYLDNKVDFAKITIDAFQIGSDGATLAKLLSQYQIEPEYTNEYYVVLLTTPFLKEADWNRLEDALHAIQVRSPKDREEPAYALPKSILHSYQTLGLPSSYVPIDEAVNQISAQTIATCPPGVPIITAGEEINEQIKNICKKCGNFRIKVLK